MRPSLHRRFAYAIIFLGVGTAILMTMAIILDPPKRCEERGGTWVVDGRYCEELESVDLSGQDEH